MPAGVLGSAGLQFGTEFSDKISSRKEPMPNIIALLKAERDKVTRQLNGLNAALAAFAGVYRGRDGAKPRGRRKLSAKGLANIRAAQKVRWAKQKGTSGDGSKRTPKRRISAAGRARIAAAARARWAQLKAGKKG